MNLAPTHVEGDEITAEIRQRLKQEGIVGKDEVTLDTLKPVGWTKAQMGDPGQYEGSEVLQFHRNSGAFKAGQRVTADGLGDAKGKLRPEHFSVYTPAKLSVAKGDVLRATGNGWDTIVRNGKTERGKHRINNGDLMTVVGIEDAGLRVKAGKSEFLVGKNYGLLAHGYVTTSHASQGKTVDRVLIAMGHESRGAINAAQFYVSVSRGRESATVYTDVAPVILREAIQKADPRMTATELMGPRKKPVKKRLKDYVKGMRDRLMRLRRDERQVEREPLHERQLGFGR